MKDIISADGLKDILENPDLIVLDATIPKLISPVGSTLVKKRFIKNSRFFDIKKTFSNQESEMPNTLPTPKDFEMECRKLGINKSSKIVVYDNLGVYSSPRVWWMFKTMGHSKVAVLDGGLPEWINRGFETSSYALEEFEMGNFKANFNQQAVVDFNFIQFNFQDKAVLVIDARSSNRFNALIPEPRESLRTGNIEGSINIPYTEVLRDGKFKSNDELENVFAKLKNETRPLVFSCGSGITACVVSLASSLILKNKKSIYDGSWIEYAQLT